MVDAIQSLGAHPFDARAVRPDFLVASAYKWLLGPYGVGFMYAAEEWRDGTPIEHNWINRRGTEDFSQLVEYEDSFQPGARRYDVGERSNFALLPMANEALRQILDWGVENVSETIGGLTDLIEGEAGDLGIEAVPAKSRARHMVGLKLGSAARRPRRRLAAEGVFVSAQQQHARLATRLQHRGGRRAPLRGLGRTKA